MTDRQLGGEDLNVDLRAGQPRLGAEGLNVDIQPPLSNQPQLDHLSLQVDFTYPQGVQFGALPINVDLVPGGVARQLANIGLMVDFVGSLVATNAARWSGSLFEMGTSSPLAYWSAGTFQSSGTKPVLWVTDHFELAP